MARFTITKLPTSEAIRQALEATEGNRHYAIMSMAGKLAKAGWNAERILAQCLEVGEQLGLSQERLREMPHHVRCVMRYDKRGDSAYSSCASSIATVAPDLDEIDERVRFNFEPTIYQERLAEISPWEPFEITAREALSTLFPDDPLLWLGNKPWFPATRWSRVNAATLSSWQFACPNPLRDERATNGGKTARNTANVAEWRFAIAECDWKLDHPTWGKLLERWNRDAGSCSTQDAQLANLWPLLETGRVAMVVDSGGKSLHFWLYVADLDESAKTDLCQRMMRLGCDHSIKKPAQFFRMPAGRRDNGNAQPVLYFNPNLPRAINK